VPGSAYGATINGSPDPEIVGPEGPTHLLAAPVLVDAGHETDVTVHFTLPWAASLPCGGATGARSSTRHPTR
jgi:hypothetical protein